MVELTERARQIEKGYNFHH